MEGGIVGFHRSYFLTSSEKIPPCARKRCVQAWKVWFVKKSFSPQFAQHLHNDPRKARRLIVSHEEIQPRGSLVSSRTASILHNFSIYLKYQPEVGRNSWVSWAVDPQAATNDLLRSKGTSRIFLQKTLTIIKAPLVVYF